MAEEESDEDELMLGDDDDIGLGDDDLPGEADDIALRDGIDDDAEGEDDDLGSDGESRRSVSPSKMTARQRGRGDVDLQETLLALPMGGFRSLSLCLSTESNLISSAVNVGDRGDADSPRAAEETYVSPDH